MLAALPLAASATASAPPSPTSPFLVGVDDDHSKWLARPDGLVAKYRDLGLEAVRVTIPWRRGQTKPTPMSGLYLHRAASLVARGQRVVVAVFGKPEHAPVDAKSRRQYCDFLHHVFMRVPFQDAQIWNEANSPQFWPPSAGPRAYEALLATCWRRLHALRQANVNVISTTAAHYDPAGFMREVGDAYVDRRRRYPIVDTFGHNPYPDHAAEPPWVRHDDPRTVGQGDLDRYLAALEATFGGTRQPVPGEGATTVWYLETGFQTTIPRGKLRYYHGEETDRFAVPPVATTTRSPGSETRRASCATPFSWRAANLGGRVLQLRAARRGPPRGLAVRRALARRDAQGVVRRLQGGGRARGVGRRRLLDGSGRGWADPARPPPPLRRPGPRVSNRRVGCRQGG